MELISEHKGFTLGKKQRNNYKIWKDEKGKFVEMFTDNGSFLFDFEDLDMVLNLKGKYDKRISIYLDKCEKITHRIVYYAKLTINGKKLYLHQLLLNYYGKGCKESTIDHIDRNTLNNRRYNLRIATKPEQNSNTHKHKKRKNTRSLPEGINYSQLPKYIGYGKEKATVNLGYREFFCIQCHPAQENKKTRWYTTKSINVSIEEKLQQALDMLKKLNNEYEATRVGAGTP